jgi:hypothetical protein
VEHGRSSPGKTLDRGEPVGPRYAHCRRVSRLDPVGPAKGEHGPGDVEPEDPLDVSPRRRGQGRVADCDVEGRMIGIGVGDDGESAHNQEDKGTAVTVSGTVLAVSREPSGSAGSF